MNKSVTFFGFLAVVFCLQIQASEIVCLKEHKLKLDGSKYSFWDPFASGIIYFCPNEIKKELETFKDFLFRTQENNSYVDPFSLIDLMDNLRSKLVDAQGIDNDVEVIKELGKEIVDYARKHDACAKKHDACAKKYEDCAKKYEDCAKYEVFSVTYDDENELSKTIKEFSDAIENQGVEEPKQKKNNKKQKIKKVVKGIHNLFALKWLKK